MSMCANLDTVVTSVPVGASPFRHLSTLLSVMYSFQAAPSASQLAVVSPDAPKSALGRIVAPNFGSYLGDYANQNPGY